MVSVLFSEPKIPQSETAGRASGGSGVRFSALQRAENSSIKTQVWHHVIDPEFQCSSASRKFLNRSRSRRGACGADRFSALQRAENSSMTLLLAANVRAARFQCSSASRKFLNQRRTGIGSAAE